MTTPIVVSPITPPAITSNRYARNGLIVSLQAQNEIVGGFNQVMAYRTRENFAMGGQLTSIMASQGAGAFEVARGYGIAGDNSATLRYTLSQAKPTLAAAVADPYLQLDIMDSGGTVIGTVQSHYGSFNGAPHDTPNEWKHSTGTITMPGGLPTGSAVQCVVNAYNNARFIGGLVWEASAPPNTANGYQQGVTNQLEILDSQRGAIASKLQTLVDNNGGTQVCITDIGFSTVSLTQKNIFDRTSTTVTANTPGITLDMRYKGRKSQTTVPITVAIYAGCATGTQGAFKLYDSTGTVLLTLGPFTSTANWYTSTIRVPMTLAKYDMKLATTTVSISTFLEYVSIFEDGT